MTSHIRTGLSRYALGHHLSFEKFDFPLFVPNPGYLLISTIAIRNHTRVESVHFKFTSPFPHPSHRQTCWRSDALRTEARRHRNGTARKPQPKWFRTSWILQYSSKGILPAETEQSQIGFQLNKYLFGFFFIILLVRTVADKWYSSLNNKSYGILGPRLFWHLYATYGVKHYLLT